MARDERFVRGGNVERNRETLPGQTIQWNPTKLGQKTREIALPVDPLGPTRIHEARVVVRRRTPIWLGGWYLRPEAQLCHVHLLLR